MFTEDLQPFLVDFGVTCVYGSQSALVLLDQPGELVLSDAQLTVDYQMTYASTDLSGLKHGDSVTVDGVAYTVRVPKPIEDGRFKVAGLKRP